MNRRLHQLRSLLLSDVSFNKNYSRHALYQNNENRNAPSLISFKILQLLSKDVLQELLIKWGVFYQVLKHKILNCIA